VLRVALNHSDKTSSTVSSHDSRNCGASSLPSKNGERTMNTKLETEDIQNRFQFYGITPEPELEKVANLKLVELLAAAPPGAQSTGTLERTGKSYLAGIRVSSHFRSFSSHAISGNAQNAVIRALERLEDQIYRWRYGDNTGNPGNNSNSSGMGNLPLARSG
jgi:hypothetical protein